MIHHQLYTDTESISPALEH